MGRIFYMMGKSASGKDSLCRELLKDEDLSLHSVILYTTRPRRENEKEGEAYFFIKENQVNGFRKSGKIIEERCYHTVMGDWRYLTIDDGQICLAQKDYLMIGTLESYRKMRIYFGKDKIIPLYIYVENGERLQRALDREKEQEIPQYLEMCRRFIADEEDFSPEKLKEAGIEKAFENQSFEQCEKELRKEILRYKKESEKDLS